MHLGVGRQRLTATATWPIEVLEEGRDGWRSRPIIEVCCHVHSVSSVVSSDLASEAAGPGSRPASLFRAIDQPCHIAHACLPTTHTQTLPNKQALLSIYTHASASATHLVAIVYLIDRAYHGGSNRARGGASKPCWRSRARARRQVEALGQLGLWLHAYVVVAARALLLQHGFSPPSSSVRRPRPCTSRLGGLDRSCMGHRVLPPAAWIDRRAGKKLIKHLRKLTLASIGPSDSAPSTPVNVVSIIFVGHIHNNLYY